MGEMYSPQQLFGSISGGRVLDVATGGGGFIGFLLQGLRDYSEIIGIDSSTRGAEGFAAAFKDNPRVHFAQMDAQRLDFADAAFDTVCIANSLHHMSDLPCVLAEMKRVLKPGGHFIIAEMYRDGQTETQMTHVLLHHWWGAIDTAMGITHHETYARQQIIDLVDGLGLEQVNFYDLSDTGDDPKQAETIRELDGIIDRYVGRASGLPGQDELHKRGEELRRRVHEVGFHGAASLLVTGSKPPID